MLDSLTNIIQDTVQNIFNFNPLFAYLVIFLIIFLETGVVIMPFLPGDSLLFLVGAVISSHGLDILFFLFFLLSLAAILGDSLNYFVGNYFGNKIISNGWIKKEHLNKTSEFYKKYGSKTILFARFFPIIRTIAPFIAGVGRMNYNKFILYNILGAVIWVFIFLFTGYFFGNISFVKENLNWFILAIIALSFIPGIFHFLSSKKSKG